MPAGHAVLTLVIAFAVAALLNAQGMHKSALSQPPGIQRDVGGTLTAGLAALSGVLQTDEPRALLKSALGRAGDDRINTKVVFDAPRRRAVATTARPAKPLYTPAHPMRLYVTGDSLITDPGPVILDRTSRDPAVKAVAATDTHPATGLVQPAVFNWFAYLPQQIDDLRPDLSVVTFGANDGLGFDDVAGAEDFGTPQWQAEYRRRVAGVMDTFVDRHSKLVWVGLPIPRDTGLAKRWELMNRIVAAEAAKRAGDVTFAPIFDRFKNKAGRYADHLPDASGQLQLARSSDGIHYEQFGADIVTDAVIKAIPTLVRLRPPLQ